MRLMKDGTTCFLVALVALMVSAMVALGPVALFAAETAGGSSLFGVASAEAVEAEAADAEHGEEAAAEHSKKESSGFPAKPIAAALTLGMAAFGTAIVQMKIGAAGAATLAERPEVAPMIIVLVALPETIVILGFVVAAMLIMF